MFRSLVPVSARYREPWALNSKLSGGLPHSEISGSKPILGSPKLIAEYHVLHRLLLPRHPPNALLALDLIQKKTGFFRWPPPEGGSTDQEYAFPPARTDARTSFTACDEAVWLVYLTWIVSALQAEPADLPALGKMRTTLMCISMHDVNSSRTGWQSRKLCDQVPEAAWWSVSGSNR